MPNPDSTLPRVLFVNRVYRPDEAATAQMLTDLAEGLAARRHAVTVLAGGTGDGNHAGVDILRVRLPHRGTRHLAGKALGYMAFSSGALWRLARTLRPGETVVLMTDPPLFAVAAAAVARRRGAAVIHWIQDIHPEVMLALHPRRSWLAGALRPLQRLRNRAWRQAACCVAISHDMARFVRAAGVAPSRLVVVENWADESLQSCPLGAPNALRQAWGLTGKFIVAYSGNLGRVHNLEPLLDAAVRLRDEPDIAFLFIGDGAQRVTLEACARAGGLTNVFFQPPQPRARLAESLAAGDLHVIALRDGCESFVYPSKLYGILAAGRPALFVGPAASEMASFLRDRQCGLAFGGDNGEDLADAIRMLAKNPARVAAMGAAATTAFREHGTRAAAILHWEKILAALPPP